MPPSDRAALAHALTRRGIATPEAFRERYGVAPDTLTPAAALALVHRHDRRAEADYPAALDALQVRLQRGLAVLADRPTPAMQARWLRLAMLSTWLIARMSETTLDRGAAWCATDAGRWYAALQWPPFAVDVIEQVEREQRLPGWSQARTPPAMKNHSGYDPVRPRERKDWG